MALPGPPLMGTFLICCLWGQGWIGGRPWGAIGWLCMFAADRIARLDLRPVDRPGIP